MIQDPHQEMDVIPEPKQLLLKVLYKTSILVVWSNCTRTLLYIIFTILLALCSLIVLVKYTELTIGYFKGALRRAQVLAY